MALDVGDLCKVYRSIQTIRSKPAWPPPEIGLVMRMGGYEGQGSARELRVKNLKSGKVRWYRLYLLEEMEEEEQRE